MKGGSFFVNSVLLTPPSQQTGTINVTGTINTSGNVTAYAVSITEVLSGSGAFTGPISSASVVTTTLNVGNIGATGTIEGNTLTLTNPVTVPNGGTGLRSVPLNQLVVGNGAGVLQGLGSGSSGYLIIGNTGGLPLWSNSISTYSMSLYGFSSNQAVSTNFLTATTSISGYSLLGTGIGRFGSVAVDDALYAAQSIRTLNLVASVGSFSSNVWGQTVSAGGTVVSNNSRFLGATSVPGVAPASAGKFNAQQADFAVDPLDASPSLWVYTTAGAWKQVSGSGGASLLHEEYTPANAATTVTLAQTPGTILYVARGSGIQRAGTDYTVSGKVLTFTSSFDGSTNVIIGYSTSTSTTGNASTLNGFTTSSTASSGQAVIPVTNSSGQLPATWIANGITASQITSGIGMQNLADNTLGSSAASITFSGISGSYKDLQDYVQARGDGALVADDFHAQFNSDTAANYDYSNLVGSNSTVIHSPSSGAASLRVGDMPAASAARANIFSAVTITIPNYVGTTAEKSYHAEGGYADSTAANSEIRLLVGSWRNTAALTTIKHLPLVSTNFVTGSRFTLQGIQ